MYSVAYLTFLKKGTRKFANYRDVSQSMGGSISFAGSAGQQVAMDRTRGVLQGGTRFISQRVKAVKVKLKAGYRVLLVTKKQ